MCVLGLPLRCRWRSRIEREVEMEVVEVVVVVEVVEGSGCGSESEDWHDGMGPGSRGHSSIDLVDGYDGPLFCLGGLSSTSVGTER